MMLLDEVQKPDQSNTKSQASSREFGERTHAEFVFRTQQYER